MRSARIKRIDELAKLLQAGGLDLETQDEVENEYYSLIDDEAAEARRPNPLEGIDLEAARERAEVIVDQLRSDDSLNWKADARQALEAELLAIHESVGHAHRARYEAFSPDRDAVLAQTAKVDAARDRLQQTDQPFEIVQILEAEFDREMDTLRQLQQPPRSEGLYNDDAQSADDV